MEGVSHFIFKDPDNVSYSVWALRKDLGGSEVEFAGGLVGGLGRMEITLREDSIMKTPNSAWTAATEDGEVLQVIDVRLKNAGARMRWLIVTCERVV